MLPKDEGRDSRRGAARVGPLLGRRPRSRRRIYVAVGVNTRGRKGPLSTRVPCRWCRRPPPPPTPAITYDETAITVTWTAAGVGADSAAGDRRPAAGAAHRHARRRATPTTSTTCRRPRRRTPKTATPQLPEVRLTAKRSPSRVSRHADRLGRDALLRRARRRDHRRRSTLESDAPPPACVTLVDTFPPARAEGAAGGRQRGRDQPDLGAEHARTISPATSCCAAAPAGKLDADHAGADPRDDVQRRRASRACGTCTRCRRSTRPATSARSSNRIEDAAR